METTENRVRADKDYNDVTHEPFPVWATKQTPMIHLRFISDIQTSEFLFKAFYHFSHVEFTKVFFVAYTVTWWRHYAAWFIHFKHSVKMTEWKPGRFNNICLVKVQPDSLGTFIFLSYVLTNSPSHLDLKAFSSKQKSWDNFNG